MRANTVAGGALALGLLATACGARHPPPTPVHTPVRQPTPTAAAAVNSRAVGLGTILVDGRGRTLYLFGKDPPGMSVCAAPCTTAFPPLLTRGAATGGRGVRTSQLGMTVRPDGTTQVTYRGRPLYHFAGDQVPGDLKGEGIDAFGAEWFVVGAATGEMLRQ